MNSADVIRRLKGDGWVPFGGKGDHQKLEHPEGRFKKNGYSFAESPSPQRG